ncbi:hypothetical protein HAX54_002648 [Datura stramonium]|uniref:Uncharacterized protein n=1 Tax=Datura stramonium TaxID=4076 RepID=A0ABS8T487_DATST|nr:hypothetical protein [Datura stramonium]
MKISVERVGGAKLLPSLLHREYFTTSLTNSKSSFELHILVPLLKQTTDNLKLWQTEFDSEVTNADAEEEPVESLISVSVSDAHDSLVPKVEPDNNIETMLAIGSDDSVGVASDEAISSSRAMTAQGEKYSQSGRSAK